MSLPSLKCVLKARWLTTLMHLVLLCACGKVVRIGARIEPTEDASLSASGDGMNGSPTSAESAKPNTLETGQTQATGDAATTMGNDTAAYGLATTNDSAGDNSVATDAGATIDNSRPLDGMFDASAAADASSMLGFPTETTDMNASPNVSCSDAVSVSPRWSFGNSLDGWQQQSTQAASLSWSAATGASAPGAILVEGTATTTGDVFVFVPMAMQDLSGVLLTAQVMVESGADVSVKLFAQSGTSYAWADGGVVDAPPGEWLCLAFAFNEPAFAVNNFDPSSVQRVGIEIHGSQYRVYLDDISY